MLVSTLKVVKTGNEIRQFYASKVIQSLHCYDTFVMIKIQSSKQYGATRSFRKLFNYSYYFKKSK